MVVRAGGIGKEYTVLVPAYICKDDLNQVVEDGVLIHNRNCVQSAELVCSYCHALFQYCFWVDHCLTPTPPSLFCFLFFFVFFFIYAGYHGYSEHDLPASRALVSAGGCREATNL